MRALTHVRFPPGALQGQANHTAWTGDRFAPTYGIYPYQPKLLLDNERLSKLSAIHFGS